MGRVGFGQLIVILGCPRSGTTWLHGMLADRPEIAGLGETYLFTEYVGELRRAFERRRSARVGLDKVLDAVEFRDCLRAFASDALGRISAGRPGVCALLEKTPSNALVWREIRALFPDALLVHVLRDPRDVVASLRAAGRSWGRSWAPTGVVGAARLWLRFVESALDVEDDPRGIVVRYESLLADTPRALARVCAAAGLPASPQWCEDVSGRHSFEQRTAGQRSGPEHFLRRGRAGAWSDDLSRRDVRIVEHIAGSLMDRLGYARATKPRAWRPFGLIAHDVLRSAGPILNRRARLVFRRWLGLPDP